ncbi:hypothetical protein HYDPIDRAFT_91476, partial [Hydnomerulius pinastri MD-312]
PPRAMVIGIVLYLDKTNISIISGNHMAHPLLLSLANINKDICCSLHGHLLLALLPVTSFIHKKSHVCTLLSDHLFHQCLNLVPKPLKIAAAIGIMMSDPIGNLHFCYTLLIVYIADTPEKSLLMAALIFHVF